MSSHQITLLHSLKHKILIFFKWIWSRKKQPCVTHLKDKHQCEWTSIFFSSLHIKRILPSWNCFDVTQNKSRSKTNQNVNPFDKLRTSESNNITKLYTWHRFSLRLSLARLKMKTTRRIINLSQPRETVSFQRLGPRISLNYQMIHASSLPACKCFHLSSLACKILSRVKTKRFDWLAALAGKVECAPDKWIACVSWVRITFTLPLFAWHKQDEAQASISVGVSYLWWNWKRSEGEKAARPSEGAKKEQWKCRWRWK